MIRKIIANGKDEVAFLKEVEKRNGETDKKVTEIVKLLRTLRKTAIKPFRIIH